MIEKVTDLTAPPTVGQAYLVPCVTGVPRFFSLFLRGREQLWPVLVPPHEDSEYRRRTRLVLREEGPWPRLVEEAYYERDPDEPLHFHLDSRFIGPGVEVSRGYMEIRCLLQEIPDYQGEIFAGVIFPNTQGVEEQELVCQRDRPDQVLPESILGRRFVERYRGKKSSLSSLPSQGH